MTTPDTKKLQDIFNVYSGSPVAVMKDGVIYKNDRNLTRLWTRLSAAGFNAMTVSPLQGFGDAHTRDQRDDRVNVSLTQDMAGIWRINSYSIG